jgi:hypothetical protein
MKMILAPVKNFQAAEIKIFVRNTWPTLYIFDKKLQNLRIWQSDKISDNRSTSNWFFFLYRRPWLLMCRQICTQRRIEKKFVAIAATGQIEHDVLVLMNKMFHLKLKKKFWYIYCPSDWEIPDDFVLVITSVCSDCVVDTSRSLTKLSGIFQTRGQFDISIQMQLWHTCIYLAQNSKTIGSGQTDDTWFVFFFWFF